MRRTEGEKVSVRERYNNKISSSVLHGKQCCVKHCSMQKKWSLCSGNSSMSLFNISSVHSNNASIIVGTSVMACSYHTKLVN